MSQREWGWCRVYRNRRVDVVPAPCARVLGDDGAGLAVEQHGVRLRAQHHRVTSPTPCSQKKCNEDPNPERSNGLLTASDGLNAAWARRAGMISYLPRSARVAGKPGTQQLHVVRNRCATGPDTRTGTVVTTGVVRVAGSAETVWPPITTSTASPEERRRSKRIRRRDSKNNLTRGCGLLKHDALLGPPRRQSSGATVVEGHSPEAAKVVMRLAASVATEIGTSIWKLTTTAACVPPPTRLALSKVLHL